MGDQRGEFGRLDRRAYLHVAFGDIQRGNTGMSDPASECAAYERFGVVRGVMRDGASVSARQISVSPSATHRGRGVRTANPTFQTRSPWWLRRKNDFERGLEGGSVVGLTLNAGSSV